MRPARAVATALFVWTAGTTFAPGAPAAREQAAALAELRVRIAALEAEVQRERRELDTTSAEVATLDRDVDARSTRLRELEAALGRKLERLRELDRERRQRGERLQEHKRALAGQLRAVQRMGHGDRLRLVLNQDDPDRAARILVYHDFYTRARAAAIRDIGAEIQRYVDVGRAISLETEKLRQLRAQTERDIDELEQRRLERRRTFARLERSVGTQDRELRQLRDDESRLEALVEEIEHAAQRRQRVDAARPFADLAGALRWPVPGTLSRRFGSLRSGDMRWHGVIIDAPGGSTVAAVSDGTVVFADEFRHLGRLIIVDHGDGWMSLYGQIAHLLKTTGETVTGGETIATLDGSPDGTAPLYFEIRKDGKPQDPQHWCTHPPTATP